jgi:CrcB protein
VRFQTTLLVAIGGALGALSRVGLSELLGGEAISSETLWVTLAINTVGALLLALLRRFGPGRLQPAISAGIGYGFLGAFTTWSAVIGATIVLAGGSMIWMGTLYLLSTLVLGVGIAWLVRGEVAS